MKIANKAIVISIILFILVALLTGVCYVSVHYFQSVSVGKAEEVEKVAKQLAKEKQKQPGELINYKTVYKGLYAASLVYNETDRKYSVLLFRRDTCWKNRYHFAGGSFDADYGEMISSNSASHGTGIIVVGGFQLPDRAKYFSFTNSDVTYSCDIQDGEALKIFIVDNPSDINGVPQMYDEKNEAVK